MSRCLEKCNDISRTKPARITFGVLLTFICCIGLYHLFNASNEMNEQRMQKFEVIPVSKGSLIYVGDDAQVWTEKLDEFLAPYKMPHPNRQKCDYNNPPAPGKVCDFSLDDLGPCNDENSYGYSKKTPCVLLKLKKNPSWLPEFMNETDLPLEMPKDLQKHILEVSNNLVAWLSCVGENPSSEENIGLIKYLPQRGFRANQISASKDALDPFVAVYFQLPTKGILIDVKCTLWTKDSADAVTFKLMVD